MLILSPASSCSDESCDPSLGGTWLGFATAVSKASTIRFVTAARNMHLHSHLSPQGSPCAVPRGAGRVRRDWRRTLRFPRPLPTRASSLRALPRVSRQDGPRPLRDAASRATPQATQRPSRGAHQADSWPGLLVDSARRFHHEGETDRHQAAGCAHTLHCTQAPWRELRIRAGVN